MDLSRKAENGITLFLLKLSAEREKKKQPPRLAKMERAIELKGKKLLAEGIRKKRS